MKVLVLGGSGFIGSHVVDQALVAGHSVRVFDRAMESFRATPKKVEFLQGDMSDTAALAEALIGVDMVFHLVSTTVPSTGNLDPSADIQGNLLATIRLLELMRAQSVRRLLYLSSGGTVYGIPLLDPVPENHVLDPISSYGIVKVAVEQYIRMEASLHGLQATILRPSNPYGPRQGHGGVQGIIGTYMWCIAQGNAMELWGDGSVVRDFIYVRDLAQLCLICADSGITGTFNVGAGQGHSVLQVIDRIGNVSGKTIEPIKKPGRKFDVPRVVLDITTAHDATGWSPRTKLETGLAETWAWVKGQVP